MRRNTATVPNLELCLVLTILANVCKTPAVNKRF